MKKTPHHISLTEAVAFINNYEVTIAGGPDRKGKRKRLTAINGIYYVYSSESGELQSYFSTNHLERAVQFYNEL